MSAMGHLVFTPPFRRKGAAPKARGDVVMAQIH
jgi:hypothetical protein